MSEVCKCCPNSHRQQAEIERLRDLLGQTRLRAGNLAALLESASVDARSIQMPGLFASLTPEQQEAALKNRGVDV